MENRNTLAVHVISLGCAKNLVDTEVMCGGLVTNGFCLAEAPEDADVVLVNTCAFIRDAREEAFQSIEWALQWKGRSRRKMVVVAGCLAQRSPKELLEKYPGIDLLIGLDDIPALPSLILAAREQKGRLPEIGLPRYLYSDETPRLTLTPRSYGYVKIAEGCDHRCAYCAIPMIRGKQRSRTVDSVVRECHQLLGQGAKELDFIAQDSSRYGADLKDGTDLEALLRKCDALDGDFWIRVLYTHPLHLTEGLLDILANGRHVVPYLDIPLQHISSSVLARMGRGMDGPSTRKLLETVRKTYPQIGIRTTFLTGFPGESEQDFQELLSFVQEFGFDRLGAFAFSPEEGTPAMTMDGQIPQKVALRRKNILLAEQQKISLQRNCSWKGKVVRVLLEDSEKRGVATGRTVWDAPEVDQLVTVSLKKGKNAPLPRFAQVRITTTGDYSLQGEEIE